MRRTADFWRGWLNHGAFPDHPWRGILQRSALTLKGLTYAPTGALLAAATTSLPETPGGERNWDYRYSWVRDSAFALWGLYTLGFDYEANSFFYFIADQIGDGSPLKVLYAVDDGVDLDESTLDHLRATRTPVPCGSATTPTTRNSTTSGARCCTRCTSTRAPASSFRRDVGEPGAPGRVRDRTVARARPRDLGEPWRAAPFHVVEDHVLGGAAIAERCWPRRWATSTWSSAGERSPTRSRPTSWSKASTSAASSRESYGSSALDASVLLGVLLGFLPPDDPRMRATVVAIAEELTDNGWSCATAWTRPTRAPQQEEGTFAICSFWLVSALVEIGEVDEASALLEKLLALASPLGLYAEELDPRTGGTSGTSPRRSRTSPDQRHDAGDPGRVGSGGRGRRPATS